VDEVIDDFEEREEGGNGSDEEGVKDQIQELKGFLGREMALDLMKE